MKDSSNRSRESLHIPRLQGNQPKRTSSIPLQKLFTLDIPADIQLIDSDLHISATTPSREYFELKKTGLGKLINEETSSKRHGSMTMKESFDFKTSNINKAVNSFSSLNQPPHTLPKALGNIIFEIDLINIFSFSKRVG